MSTIDFQLNSGLGAEYRSHSQQARILTETWVGEHIYCPRCGNPKIMHFPNNKKVADFYCPECQNQYELKSKKGNIGQKIADGAYDSFIQRITSNDNPDFLIMSYDPKELIVDQLWIIPKNFFVPDIVERRKPLASTAKRAGWVGCNILFDKIPQQGQIPIIANRNWEDKKWVMQQLQRSYSLYAKDLEKRGWLLDVLKCVNTIPKQIFLIEDIYYFEEQLAILHPRNHNIKAKIRQQLQVLRDKGFLEFIHNGVYKKI